MTTNSLADTVSINLGVFIAILGVLLTASVGIFAWALRKLIDLGELQARSTAQLDSLEKRTSAVESDVRVLGKMFPTRPPDLPPEKNRPSPGI